MQGKGGGEQRRVHLLRAVEKVRRGLAVEAEGTVAVRLQRDKGQRGVGAVGGGNVAHVHTRPGQLGGDLRAEGVIPQLGQQGAAAAQPCKGRCHIGGGAAHPGRKGGDRTEIAAGLGRDHIDQRLADRIQSVMSHRKFLLTA